MNARITPRIVVIGLAVIGVSALGWWLATRASEAPPDARPATDPPAAVADAELERLRAEIEEERAAELAERRDAVPDEAPRLAVRTAGTLFPHDRHRDLACVACHGTGEAHGTLIIAVPRQCRECHHGPPLALNCATCHPSTDFVGERRRRVQEFRFTTVPAVTRELVFAHAQHTDVACVSCHAEPVTLRVTVGCSDCHREHHQPQTQCMACHPSPREGVHTAAVHLSCTAAGCHSPSPVPGVPRTRQFCLACHQDMVDHERTGNCADCHRLPPPRASADGRPAATVAAAR